MKRNYLIKNMGRICLAAGLMVTTLLSSCLKDSSPGSIDFSKSPALIGWQYAGLAAKPYTAVLLPKAGVTLTTEITLSVASVTQSTPVTATVVESSDALKAYTTTNPELPAADYSLPNGGKITINPGQQTISFVITFAGDKIDFSQNYALALQLTDASGALIASNLQTAIVLLKVKSLYEGDYKVVSGATTRYHGGTVASGLQDQFAVTETDLFYGTYTANTVLGQAGSSAFGLTVAITINGSTVNVGADPTNPAATFPYSDGDSKGQSSYNASTKTLTLHYSYLNGAGALREVDMVLVGPQ